MTLYIQEQNYRLLNKTNTKCYYVHLCTMLCTYRLLFCVCRPYYYTVSQKNIPDIFDCNLKTNYQILIVLGKNIPDTTCYQTTI